MANKGGEICFKKRYNASFLAYSSCDNRHASWLLTFIGLLECYPCRHLFLPIQFCYSNATNPPSMLVCFPWDFSALCVIKCTQFYKIDGCPIHWWRHIRFHKDGIPLVSNLFNAKWNMIGFTLRQSHRAFTNVEWSWQHWVRGGPMFLCLHYWIRASKT